MPIKSTVGIPLINQFANAVFQMRDAIEDFYRGHPERQAAARQWWEEHKREEEEHEGHGMD